MNVDINKLAKHFARTPFQVEGVYHNIFEPGWSGWQKTMPYPGFIFQLKGNATLVFDQTTYQLGPNSITHGGANMSLDMSVNGKSKWEYILVLYKILGTEPNELCLPDTHFQFQTGESPRLIDLIWNLWKAYNQPDAFSEFQTEMLFRCALGEAFICSNNHSNLSSGSLFQNISSYLQEHYMDALTMPHLAELNGINPNRLSYLFYKHAGMGPGDYLLHYRLNRAKELLLYNNAPLREISHAVGFNDPFYFSKAFKKKFDISPSEFRNKFRNNTC